tara:strand:+ start:12104 stop:12829 length:726 start_codon:yes stop_codon:yes gene_type:complete
MSRKICLVTGGTRGIGAAISILLEKNNYKVIANYASNDQKALEFAEANNIKVKKFDVSNYEDCKEKINSIEEEFGPISILINNAGITRDAAIHKMTQLQWSEVISTNLNSAFNLVSNVISGMRNNGFGRIIHVSSVNGQKGQFGQTNYAASKAAIFGFSKSLALEVAGKGITSNVVAPGYINTEMVAAIREDILKSIVDTIPAKRLGESTEIAEMILFLISDKGNYINGATFSVNGGLRMD